MTDEEWVVDSWRKTKHYKLMMKEADRLVLECDFGILQPHLLTREDLRILVADAWQQISAVPDKYRRDYHIFRQTS